MMIPRQIFEPWPQRERFGEFPGDEYLLATYWPTVTETADAVAMCTADTILQILRGDAKVWPNRDETPVKRRRRRYRVRRALAGVVTSCPAVASREPSVLDVEVPTFPPMGGMMRFRTVPYEDARSDWMD